MKVPAFVTDGKVFPEECSARWRCEQLAKRLRIRYGSAHPFEPTLTRLCGIWSTTDVWRYTAPQLAKRLRLLKSGIRSLLVNPR